MNAIRLGVFLLVVSSGASLQQAPSFSASRKGIFTGELQLHPIGDGIHMEVVKPISYNDGEGHTIDVAATFVTDGASIPRALWSVVGSPFSGGNYVEAAVIHDQGCVSHKYSWQITHMMFYTAMLDSGVSEHQAKLLYFGVRFGGPRWTSVTTSNWGGAYKTRPPRPEDVTPPRLTEAQIREFDKELTSSEVKGAPLTIAQINRSVPKP